MMLNIIGCPLWSADNVMWGVGCVKLASIEVEGVLAVLAGTMTSG